jgi:hypothetical protein
MAQFVSPQFLLKGAVYSLEQCGCLLRSANTLYRSEDYASTVVMAAFARKSSASGSCYSNFDGMLSAGSS